jgi:acyl dehydratase
MGIAARAVLEATTMEASALRSLRVRFSAPVYPGEMLRTEIWRDGNRVQLRTTAVERGVTVISTGMAVLEDVGQIRVKQRKEP